MAEPNIALSAPTGKPKLRDYQNEFVTELRAALRDHKRVVGVLATGGGKTVCFSYITHGVQEREKSCLIMVHRLEIVDQIAESLNEFGVYPGLIMPGISMTREPVQVGMVQTIARRFHLLRKPHLIVIDECHHAVASQYQSILDLWPDVPVLGVTATPLRLDGKGLGAVFKHMVKGKQTGWLIDNKYLANFRYFCPNEAPDLSGVKTVAGDYNQHQLEEAVDTKKITGSAVGHYAEFLNGRPTIVFCITVDHCYHVAQQYRDAGWSAEVIEGNMPKKERKALVNRLADGTLNVLVSCNVVSEGFDVPRVAGVQLLRPTKSLAMFLQMIGRALRLKPDRSDAVILDHVGNVHIHGMPDLEREWSLEAKPPKGPSPRTCKECYRVFPNGTKFSEIKELCGLDRNFEEDGPCGMEPDKPAEAAEGGRMIEVVDGKLQELTGGRNLKAGSLKEQVAWAGETQGDVLQLNAEAEINKNGEGI